MIRIQYFNRDSLSCFYPVVSLHHVNRHHFLDRAAVVVALSLDAGETVSKESRAIVCNKSRRTVVSSFKVILLDYLSPNIHCGAEAYPLRNKYDLIALAERFPAPIASITVAEPVTMSPPA